MSHLQENLDRRYLAALNACQGISTEALEGGVVKELLEATKAQHQALDILFVRLIELDKNFLPSKSGLPWEAMVKGNAAIAKAEAP